ncbi:hypothetical protein BDR22DRAFT_889433 [Usnea florida]
MDKCLRSLTSCALLLAFCTSTNAALRLGNSQSSSPLSLVQINASTTNPLALPHVGTTFPPGPQPDEDPWYYDVPYANPHMNIKFRDYQLIAERNETDVEETFRKAVVDCTGRHTTLMPDRKNYYWSGSVNLGVEPQEGNPGQAIHLTYGIWGDALTGLNQFRLFYPHLDFGFEIYVYDDDDEELYVGLGYLSVD